MPERLIIKAKDVLASAPTATLNMGVLPPSLAYVRTSSGRSWHSVTLRQLAADLARRKQERSLANRPIDANLDDLLATFLRLNTIDPNSHPERDNAFLAAVTRLRNAALKTAREKTTREAAASKESQRQALLRAIRDIENLIRIALMTFNFFLAGQLALVMLDLLCQLAAL